MLLKKEYTLDDTTKMMLSGDFRERFKAEYWQDKIRTERLRSMVMKYKNDKLDFTPKCSVALLASQLHHMEEKLRILEERAIVEDINLEVTEDA